MSRLLPRPNHDISPIDEEDDFALPPSKPDMSTLSDLPSQQRASSRQGDTPSPNARSNIPMMRRERRQQKGAEAAGRVRAVQSQERLGGIPPREQILRQPSPVPNNLKPADSRERLRQPSPVPHNLKAVESKEQLRQPTVDYSHKPSNSNGRAGTEKAGPSPDTSTESTNGLGISTMTAERRGTSPVPPKNPSMGSTRQSASDTDPAAAAFTSNKPGWRGASGRAAIIEPVQDNPTVAPLRLPPRSNKRGSTPSSDGSGPSPAPGPNPSTLGGGGGEGAGRENGVGGTDLAISSPPINPETQLKEKDQQQQRRQTQIGGVAGAERKGGVASSMVNTFRKFIPSSQRQPSSSGHTPRTSSGHVTPQGYPSPPLSSSPTLLGGGGSAAVSATVNADANAHAFNVNADENTRRLPLQQQHMLSAQPSPTASHPPIRRKRVGSGNSSAQLDSGHGAKHQPKDSFTSSVYSQQTETNRDQEGWLSQEARPQPTLNTKSLPGVGNADSTYVQPPSRFSVTTYATSAYSSTPRDSLEQFDRNHYNEADAPPLPTPPKDIPLSANDNNNKYDNNDYTPNDKPLGGSVMDRSRPKLRSKTTAWDVHQEEPVKISLSKPWMSTAGANSAGINTQSSPPRTGGVATRATSELSNKKENTVLRIASESTNTPRPPSIVSVDKALPLPPPEATASSVNDRVAMINARLGSLGNRRININRSIKQMTELMPRDNLMAAPEVLRKRELEKLKVQELERELADVQREEHELGMKLHRAYKRLDRHAEYEPTTLWVRRATG